MTTRGLDLDGVCSSLGCAGPAADSDAVNDPATVSAAIEAAMEKFPARHADDGARPLAGQRYARIRPGTRRARTARADQRPTPGHRRTQ